MKALFACTEYFPGVYHLADPLGVRFTLIVAGKGALLFDAGYGLFDPRPYLEELLKRHDLQVDDLAVMVSHAHHDHLPGVRWFDSFYIHPRELPFLKVYTGKDVLGRVLARAGEQGVIPENFDEVAFLEADYQGLVQAGLPVVPGIEILPVPGHTPGSLVVYVPEYKLLLSADNWNPTTWLFFPEAIPAPDYAANMGRLLSLDFEHVLCAHSGDLFPGTRLRSYIRGLRPETFAGGTPTETPYPEIKTLLCHPEPGTNLVFRCFT